MSMITAALGGYAVVEHQARRDSGRKDLRRIADVDQLRARGSDRLCVDAGGLCAPLDHGRRRKCAPSSTWSIDTLRRALAETWRSRPSARNRPARLRPPTNVQRAVENWNNMRLRLTAGTEPDVNWDTLDRYAATVDQQVDLLVNYTAGDGFTYRQIARSTASPAKSSSISPAPRWRCCFPRSWPGCWRGASSARSRPPPTSPSASPTASSTSKFRSGSADELGALLVAMRRMRDNIRAMMEREVEQRRSAQSRLADALESSREGVVVADADGRLALANPQAADFLEHPGGIAAARHADLASSGRSWREPARRMRRPAASTNRWPRRCAWPTAAGCE